MSQLNITKISNDFIILNMSNWIINQCLILSYHIEIYPLGNSSLNRYYSFNNNYEKIQINNLQSNSSLHEVDWYRRSIEINKDQLDEANQIQLITNKHISQTKFQHQQANIIKNKCSLLQFAN